MSEIFSDEYFMKMALQQAQIAFEENEIPIGAIVVFKNQIIGKSHNLTERLNDVTAHAEIQAITAAADMLGGKYLKDCTMYVTVEPCIMCAGAIGWSQLSRLVYGVGDNKRGYTAYEPLPLHPKTTITKGVCEEQCAILMKEFFKDKR